ncbi:MAG: hypothetical protein O3A47_06815 [Chloroflexi bacterium]|nr:hypothetical protein [Chloroflexota bacterium]
MPNEQEQADAQKAIAVLLQTVAELQDQMSDLTSRVEAAELQSFSATDLDLTNDFENLTQDTFPAKLLTHAASGFYTWAEVQKNSAGTGWLDTFTGQRTSAASSNAHNTNSLEHLLIGTPTTTYVVMNEHTDQDGDASYSFTEGLPAGAADGQVFQWDAGGPSWILVGGGPNDNEVLIWDAAAGTWTPGVLSGIDGAPGAKGADGGTMPGGTAEGQLLQWDADTSLWIVVCTPTVDNSVPVWDAASEVWQQGDLADIDSGAGAALGGVAGDILYHNGTIWAILLKPTGFTEDPVLRHNGTAPYWQEPTVCP